MPRNLALHQADVRLPDGSILERVTVTVRAGVAKATRNREVVAVLPASTIDEVSRSRFWRVAGPDGEWMVKRLGGCRSCSASARWPS